MTLLTPESIAAMGRLLIAAMLVGLEQIAVGLDRSEEQKHRCMRAGFLFLAGAEGLVVLGDVLAHAARLGVCCYAWLAYYPLSLCGFLYLSLAFTSKAQGERPGAWAHQLHVTFRVCMFILVAGLVLGVSFRASDASAGFAELGARRLLWSVATMGVLVWLGLHALNHPHLFSSGTTLRLFLTACGCLLAGAAARFFWGPAEPLAAFGYAALAAAAVIDHMAEREQKRVHEVMEKDRELRLLHHIATRLKSTFHLEELFDILLMNLVDDLGAVAAAVFVREGDSLVAKAIQGTFPPPVPPPNYAVTRKRFLHDFLMHTPVPADQGVLGRVVQTRQPVVIDDALHDESVEQTVPDLIQIQSTMAFPILIEDQVYGVIQLVNRREGRPFSERERDFMQLVVEQAALAIHNARLHQEMIEKQRTEQELVLARDVQLRLIPRELPRMEALDLAAVYKAAHEIGGDYYDFYPIDEEHLGIVIADVAGKGVPGALVMIMTRTILKMLAAGSLSTADILSQTNEAIAPELRQGMFVTALYAIFDQSRREIRFSSAGHNPLILVRAGADECEFIKPKGMALGFATGPQFSGLMEQRSLSLQPGDLVFLYTDGVTEAMNADREEFGEERLAEFLVRHSDLSARALLDALVDEIVTYAGGEPQYDDITMVALRVK